MSASPTDRAGIACSDNLVQAPASSDPLRTTVACLVADICEGSGVISGICLGCCELYVDQNFEPVEAMCERRSPITKGFTTYHENLCDLHFRSLAGSNPPNCAERRLGQLSG